MNLRFVSRLLQKEYYHVISASCFLLFDSEILNLEAEIIDSFHALLIFY